MDKSFEEMTRETMGKIRDASVTVGILTGLRIVKTIIDQADKGVREKYEEIKAFTEKTLENDPFVK